MLHKSLITFIGTLCFLSTSISAQFLVMPTTITITNPPNLMDDNSSINAFDVLGVFSETLYLHPSYTIENQNVDMVKLYKEVTHDMVLDNLRKNEDFSFVNYNPKKDTTLNVNQLYHTLANDLMIFQTNNTKTLFGKPKQRAMSEKRTQPITIELSERYEADFLIYVAITAIEKKPIIPSSYDSDQFKGCLAGFAWIVDAETGSIVETVSIQPKNKIAIVESQRGELAYSKIDINNYEKMSQKLIKKLTRKIENLYE